jgi:hypothetical protein
MSLYGYIASPDGNLNFLILIINEGMTQSHPSILAYFDFLFAEIIRLFGK